MSNVRTVSVLAARRAVLAAVVAQSLLATPAVAQSIPDRLADTTYWRMVTTMAEPDGYFRSDNLVGNESNLQWVINDLQKSVGAGSVYLGVAPDQNFTYIVALKPKIAFIVDIRRGAMLQHLMYKAITELAVDRADFLSRLFSRPRPAGLDSNTTVDSLVRAFASVAGDTALYRKNFAALREQLSKKHGFELSDRDYGGIDYVYSAFYLDGPSLTYNFSASRGSSGGGFGGGYGGGRGMPGFGSLLVEVDGSGATRSYLATEANYRWLRDFESKNLLVPIVGDFAGPKALRGVGQWVRDHKATIGAFYTSNVEQYLFQDPNNWRNFYQNVATLPVTESSLFIRSLSNGYGFRNQGPNGRSVQLISSITETVKQFEAGRIVSYNDIIQLAKP